ncbi:MAG: hypothetical protein MHM6MM_004951 [Cercozoa sp. M6MM]
MSRVRTRSQVRQEDALFDFGQFMATSAEVDDDLGATETARSAQRSLSVAEEAPQSMPPLTHSLSASTSPMKPRAKRRFLAGMPVPPALPVLPNSLPQLQEGEVRAPPARGSFQREIFETARFLEQFLLARQRFCSQRGSEIFVSAVREVWRQQGQQAAGQVPRQPLDWSDRHVATQLWHLLTRHVDGTRQAPSLDDSLLSDEESESDSSCSLLDQDVAGPRGHSAHVVTRIRAQVLRVLFTRSTAKETQVDTWTMSGLVSHCRQCRRLSPLSLICTECGAQGPHPMQLLDEKQQSVPTQKQVEQCIVRGLEYATRQASASGFDSHGGDVMFLFKCVVNNARQHNQVVYAAAVKALRKMRTRWRAKGHERGPKKNEKWTPEKLLGELEALHALRALDGADQLACDGADPSGTLCLHVSCLVSCHAQPAMCTRTDADTDLDNSGRTRAERRRDNDKLRRALDQGFARLVPAHLFGYDIAESAQELPPRVQRGYCRDCDRVHRASHISASDQKAQECWRCVSGHVDYDRATRALVWTSVLEDCDVRLRRGEGDVGDGPQQPVTLAEIAAQLPSLRPYGNEALLDAGNFSHACYFITHLLFVASSDDSRSWGARSLDPADFVEELVFLLAHMRDVVRHKKDAELVGEFLQSLRLLGLDDSHPLQLLGMNFLLERERTLRGAGQGGMFVPSRSCSYYMRYHAVYCAVAGLATRQIFGYKHEPMLAHWRVFSQRFLRQAPNSQRYMSDTPRKEAARLAHFSPKLRGKKRASLSRQRLELQEAPAGCLSPCRFNPADSD